MDLWQYKYPVGQEQKCLNDIHVLHNVLKCGFWTLRYLCRKLVKFKYKIQAFVNWHSCTRRRVFSFSFHKMSTDIVDTKKKQPNRTCSIITGRLCRRLLFPWLTSLDLSVPATWRCLHPPISGSTSISYWLKTTAPWVRPTERGER